MITVVTSTRPVRLAVAAAALVAAVAVPLSGHDLRADAAPTVIAGSDVVGTARYTPPPGAVYLSGQGSDSAPGSLQQPVQSLARALSVAPTGGTIVIRGGVYRQTAVVSKSVTLQNYPGEEVWFDGSAGVTGWVKDGTRWRHDGWTTRFDSSPTYTKGAPDSTEKDWQFVNPAAPMAAHPDQMWVNGLRLRQSASLAGTSGDTFYLDEASSRLYVGVDPNGKDVRATTLAQALNVRASDVVLRGIGFRRYAPSVWQLGAIVLEKPGARLENDVIREMSTTGLSILAAGVSLHKVTVQQSGMLGIHGRYADKLQMDGVLSQQNNNEHFNIAPVSGGAKIGTSRDVLIENSEFSNNYGQGFWQDLSTYDSTYRSDRFTGNTGNGLFLEISGKALVGDSVILDNNLDGLKVNNTSDVQIWNNTLIGNGRAIDLVQDGRRNSVKSDPAVDPRVPWPDPEMPWQLKSVRVANNVIGPPAATANCLICVEDYSHQQSAEAMGVKADGDILVRDSASAPRWSAIWSTGKGDPLVFTTLSAFSDRTGQEKRGREYVDPTLLARSGTLDARVQSLAGQVAISLPTAIADRLGRTGFSAHLGAWFTNELPAPSPSASTSTAAPAPSGSELFHDEFNRTMAGGWGSADVGGAWLTSDLPERFSVAEGKGQLKLNAGDGLVARLPQVTSDRVNLLASLSVDKRARAAGHYLEFKGRDLAGVGTYSAKMRIAGDGSVTWWLLDSLHGSESYLKQVDLPLTYTPGTKLWVRVEVTGTSPTVVRAKAWKDGTTEPATWSASASDSTSELQFPGAVSIFSYTSGADDGGPVTIRYHRVVLTQ